MRNAAFKPREFAKRRMDALSAAPWAVCPRLWMVSPLSTKVVAGILRRRDEQQG